MLSVFNDYMWLYRWLLLSWPSVCCLLFAVCCVIAVQCVLAMYIEPKSMQQLCVVISVVVVVMAVSLVNLVLCV